MSKLGKRFKNILQKYKSMSKPLKAALWFTIMSVFQKGIVFLVTPIYTRILSTTEYGYYSLFTTWFSFFSIFATLNLAAGGFNNAMLKYENQKKQFVSSMMGLGNLFTLLTFVIVFFFVKHVLHWNILDDFSLICIFAVLLVSPAFECWCSEQRFDYNYRAMCIVTLIQAILVPSVSIALAYFSKEKKYSLVLGYVIIQVTLGTVFYIYNLVKGKTYFEKEYWRYALKFNIPLIPHYLSAIVLGQADRIMINNYCGESQVGIYSLGYNISLLVSVFVHAITTAYTPWLFRQIKVNNYKEIKKTTNYILIIIGGITVCGTLMGPEIISILGSHAYREALWVLPPVMISCYLTLLYNFFACIEFYYEKSIFVMFSSVVAAISNVILNAIFIPQYGFIAAGYTTLASYIILSIMHYIFMKIIIKDKIMQGVYDEKFIFIFSVFIVIVALLIMFLYQYTFIRYFIVFGMIGFVMYKRNDLLNLIARMRK